MSRETKVIKIQFVGIDWWSRPVYKDIDSSAHYGSVNVLFPNKAIAPNSTPEEINRFFVKNPGQLEYFGHEFDCEPMGGLPSHYKLEIVEVHEAKLE